MTTSQPVDTRAVQGRRSVRYESFDDLLADAESLARVPTRAVGNWSAGQIYRHLAVSIDAMIDRSPFQLPAPMRWLLRLLFLRRMTTRTLAPGFQLPRSAARMIPPPTETGAGLDLLRRAIARIKSTDERAPHGGFGRLTREQWDAFQLRHAELHMSFLVPTSPQAE